LPGWLSTLARCYAPAGMAVALGTAESDLPAALDKPARPGVNAWVCRGVNCLAPIGEVDALLREYVPKAAERI